MENTRKRIGFIGNFGNEQLVGGQIAKTRELFAAMLRREGVVYHFLEDFLRKGLVNKNIIPDCFYVLDLINKNPFILSYKLLKIFRISQNIIIIMSSRSYFNLLPIVSFLNRIYKRNLYEFVIGGTRQEQIGDKEIIIEKKMKKIFVETTYMRHCYHNLGLKNAEYMPNFKQIVPIDEVVIETRDSNILRCCTYSRIDSKKGIDVAVKVFQRLASQTDKIMLDIIGPVDIAYREEFESILQTSTKNIRYIGIIDGNKSKETLQKYDILIFPTNWESEGFPGSFVDAMQAGLAILATDKENFKDIVCNDENGFLFPEGDVQGYCEKLLELSKDTLKLRNMQKKSLLECKKYNTDDVLKNFLDEIK